MTYKEAIEAIESDFEMGALPGKHLEAYNLAIKALRLASIALTEKLTEQEKLVIIRAKIRLDNVALQYYRDKFKKEYEEGLIVLPEYFEATVHDVIHDVKIEGGST